MSNFKSTKSLTNFKAEHGNISVVKNPQNGNIFFTTEDGINGYISKAVQEKIVAQEPLGVLCVSYMEAEDFTGYMLHTQSSENVMMTL
jgi:hypothetical protein